MYKSCYYIHWFANSIYFYQRYTRLFFLHNNDSLHNSLENILYYMAVLIRLKTFLHALPQGKDREAEFADR